MNFNKISEKDSLRIVTLEADSYYDIGFAHGQILKKEIHEMIDGVYLYVDKFLGKFYSYILRYIIAPATPVLSRKLLKKHRREMHGIADGAKTSFKNICMLNAIYEGGNILDQYFKFLGCSSFLRVMPDDSVIVAKTSDIIDDEIFSTLLTKHRTIFKYKIKKECSTSEFLTASYPGILTGDFAILKNASYIGFNDGGSITKKHIFKNKSVISILRDLFENCQTVDEIIEKLKSTHPLHPFLVMTTDGTKANSYTIDFTERKTIVYPLKSDWVINTNFIHDEIERNFHYKKSYQDSKYYISAIKRYENIEKHIGSCKDIDSAIEIIKLHDPKFDGFNGSVSNMSTDQGLVYDPKNKRLLMPNGNKVPITYWGKWVSVQAL